MSDSLPIEELVDWTLEELVYAGDEGVSISHLQDLIRRGILNRREALEKASRSDLEDQHVEELKSKVWDSLRARRLDISVGHDGIGNHLSLNELEALPVDTLPHRQPPIDANVSQEADIDGRFVIGAAASSSHAIDEVSKGGEQSQITTDSESDLDNNRAKPQLRTQPYVHVSQNRTWLTLAGHEVDPKKIPTPEWNTLYIIAMARGNGILQGELITAAETSPQWIGRRTNFLLKNNYIVRTKAVEDGKNSWHFVLKSVAVNPAVELSSISQREAQVDDLPQEPQSPKSSQVPVPHVSLPKAIAQASPSKSLLKLLPQRRGRPRKNRLIEIYPTTNPTETPDIEGEIVDQELPESAHRHHHVPGGLSESQSPVTTVGPSHVLQQRAPSPVTSPAVSSPRKSGRISRHTADNPALGNPTSKLALPQISPPEIPRYAQYLPPTDPFSVPQIHVSQPSAPQNLISPNNVSQVTENAYTSPYLRSSSYLISVPGKSDYISPYQAGSSDNVSKGAQPYHPHYESPYPEQTEKSTKKTGLPDSMLRRVQVICKSCRDHKVRCVLDGMNNDGPCERCLKTSTECNIIKQSPTPNSNPWETSNNVLQQVSSKEDVSGDPSTGSYKGREKPIHHHLDTTDTSVTGTDKGNPRPEKIRQAASAKESASSTIGSANQSPSNTEPRSTTDFPTQVAASTPSTAVEPEDPVNNGGTTYVENTQRYLEQSLAAQESISSPSIGSHPSKPDKGRGKRSFSDVNLVSALDVENGRPSAKIVKVDGGLESNFDHAKQGVHPLPEGENNWSNDNNAKDAEVTVKRTPRGEGIRRSVYTSYDEYQRQAGIPGVYFDIPGLKRPNDGSGKRRARSKIAIFKSERLKTIDFDNLESNRAEYLLNPSEPALQSTDLHPISLNIPVRANAIESKDASAKQHSVMSTKEILDAPRNDPIEAEIAVAGSVLHPVVSCRLSVRKDNLVGNLYLSSDKRTVTFVPLEPGLSLPSIIHITAVSKAPVISDAGSFPMYLEITTAEEGDMEITQKYRFIASEPEMKAANDMRAKIATAMAILEFQGLTKPRKRDPASSGSSKPFKCETCDGSWKNMEGLKYHTTRAMVSCNPNYVPAADGSKPDKRKRKRQTVSLAASRLRIPTDEVESSQQLQGESNESEGSFPPSNDPSFMDTGETTAIEQSLLQEQDSDYEPALERSVRKSSRPSRVSITPKSTHTKSVTPRSTPKTVSEQNLQISNLARPLIIPPVTADHHQSVNNKARKELIMKLLDANRGVFPGDRGIWYALASAWLKKYPGTGLLEYKYCNLSVANLEDSGHIVKIRFSFKNAGGHTQLRSVIALQGIDAVGEAVTDVKTKIKELSPQTYIPDQFKPSESVQKLLEIEDKIYIAEVNRTISASDPALERWPPSEAPSPDSPESSSQEDPDLDFINAPLHAPGSDDDDDYIEEQDIGPRKKARFLRSMGTSDILMGSITSEQKRSRWHQYSFNGPEEQSYSDHDADLGSPSPAANLAEEVQHDQQEAWNSPAITQDFTTGIWNSSVTTIQSPEMKKDKVHQAFKICLPEPITLMQTSDSSSWYFRPFGHGVKPIFARPSKRTEASDAYLRRIESGHRPVVMPKNPAYGPAPPGKWRLAERAGIPRNQSRKASPTPETHDTLPPAKRKYVRTAPLRHLPSKLKSVVTSAEEDIYSGTMDFKPRSVNSTRMGGKLSPTHRNPGLDSLLSLENRPHQLEFLAPNTFLDEIDDQEVLSRTSTFPTVPPRDEHTSIEAVWSEGSAFTLENLPYDELRTYEELESDGGEDANTSACRSLGGHVDKLQKTSSRGASYDASFGAPETRYTTRRFTALPGDVEGLEHMLSQIPDTAVQVDRRLNNLRRRMKKLTFTEQQEQRLMVAVVAIQTLAGGLEKNIDWVLISGLFNNCTVAFLTRHWPSVQLKNKSRLEKLANYFPDRFLRAYERGELPPIDFNHLCDYDWDHLIDWVMRSLENEVAEDRIYLPSTRAGLEALYDIKDVDPTPRAYRDDFFNPVPPVHKRMDFATSEPYSRPLFASSTQPEHPELVLAKSWIRASALVRTENYDARRVSDQLRPLGNNLVAAAVNSLQDSKVLVHKNKGRAAPGRSYEISDNFQMGLKRALDETYFTDAVAFKSNLDERFCKGEQVFVEWASEDGIIMAITNLQAWGRIRCIPTGIGDNRFGLTDGNYQTKQMDKARLRFDIEIVPTDSYIYDSENPILQSLTGRKIPPPTDPNGRLPLWFDINHDFVPWTWRKIVSGVLGTMAFRPGMSIKEIVRVHRPSLEEWEARLLMSWFESVGAVVELLEGVEGWSVAEWWWAIAGMQCTQ